MSTVHPVSVTVLFRTVLAVMFVASFSIYHVQAQNRTLEILDTATLQQQMDHLGQRMNIYDGYRAVRDDIFLKMMKNSLDSLNTAKGEISRLESTVETLRSDKVSLDRTLQQVTEERDLAIKNKNSLSLLGINMNKLAYNTIMWFIVLALVALLVILFMIFKRSFVVTRQTTKDLEETREEFDNYRQQSRERYEKLVVQHHKEILKLKGKKPGIAN
jgi:hypothetical protein